MKSLNVLADDWTAPDLSAVPPPPSLAERRSAIAAALRAVRREPVGCASEDVPVATLTVVATAPAPVEPDRTVERGLREMATRVQDLERSVDDVVEQVRGLTEAEAQRSSRRLRGRRGRSQVMPSPWTQELLFGA